MRDFHFKFLFIKDTKLLGLHLHCWCAGAAFEGCINFDDAANSQCVGSCQSVVSGIQLQPLAATYWL